MEIISKKISRDELNKMDSGYFEDKIKAVVDIEKQIIGVDAELHADAPHAAAALLEERIEHDRDRSGRDDVRQVIHALEQAFQLHFVRFAREHCREHQTEHELRYEVHQKHDDRIVEGVPKARLVQKIGEIFKTDNGEIAHVSLVIS